jgi:hypothetical protein
MVSHIKNKFDWKQKGKENFRTKVFSFIRNVYAGINHPNSTGTISAYATEETEKGYHTKVEQEKAKVIEFMLRKPSNIQ